MNEVLFYQLYDVAGTLVEMVDMILLMSVLMGEKIRSKNNIGIAVLQTVITVAATYSIPVMVLKSVLLALTLGFIWSIVKRQSCFRGIAIALLCVSLVCAIQTMANLMMSFLWDNPGFKMGTVYVSNWKWSLFMQMLCLVFCIIFYAVLRNTQFKWGVQDLLLAGIAGLAELVIGAFSTEKLLQEGVVERSGLFFASFLFLVIVFLIVHFQQTSLLREKEEKERLHLQSLELEIAHFQSKMEEEKKVRRLYHDMKNLLLVARMNQGENSLLDSVEQELEEYGQYYECGNAILDVILKEKMNAAKKKGIDMQVKVDFTEGNFIGDRDIITIFGNALDNAIEASEKIPAEEALITVKAGRVRNMLSILFENNRAEECNPDLQTTKEDGFLHGFGITNIRNAVDRYDGVCTIEAPAKRFLLQILIPVP